MESSAQTSSRWTLKDLPLEAVNRPKIDPRAVLAKVLSDFDERVEEVRAEEELPRRIEAVFLKGAAAIDRETFRKFQADLLALGDAVFQKAGGQYNYLDIARYLAIKAHHVVELRLDRASPLKILDLATGGGHFPFLAKQYGHEVIGIDLNIPIYAKILGLYSVERIAQPIIRMQRMPVAGPFDVITALRPMFNRSLGDPTHRFWTIDEWIWFIEYLCSLLRYPGRIYFSLNRYFVQQRDTCDDLLDLFEANGASVCFDSRTVLFKLDGPIKLRK